MHVTWRKLAFKFTGYCRQTSYTDSAVIHTLVPAVAWEPVSIFFKGVFGKIWIFHNGKMVIELFFSLEVDDQLLLIYILSMLIFKIFQHNILDCIILKKIKCRYLLSCNIVKRSTPHNIIHYHTLYAPTEVFMHKYWIYTHVPNFQPINGEETKIFNKLFIFHTLWYKWCIWYFHLSITYLHLHLCSKTLGY